MRYAPLFVCLFAVACGGESTPYNPSAVPPVAPATPPMSTTLTIGGRVTATNGAQPLAGIAVTLGSSSFVSDPSGAFQTTFPFAQGALRVTLAGAGIVPRTAFAAANNSRQLALDAIALGGGFDQNFYRQFVRNTLDAPTTMESLRRWLVNPNIYLMTVDERGVALDAKTLDSAEATIRDSVPLWTASKLSVATFERGTVSKISVPGWITVQWSAASSTIYGDAACGQAPVGANPGTIVLFYKNSTPTGSCRCAGVSEMRPLTVRHELGHALGYWHTDSDHDVMYGKPNGGCDGTPSARERYHAAIAYSRSFGNTDPDNDTASSVLSLPASRVVF